jgi:hypothetical protein
MLESMELTLGKGFLCYLIFQFARDVKRAFTTSCPRDEKHYSWHAALTLGEGCMALFLGWICQHLGV